ncbi:hypothetical protein L6164_023870 [Bauhinia variegata]|uniref:Uncharacterized protein n=1 Tax=Bauhinia variegata TaxID=167791 RepID=A0ACB9MLM5_BAUVA|nr:hypothetical protein L6164_023870 [Bauhinia variegata]
MSFRKTSTLLMILVIFVAVLSENESTRVEASRVLTQDFVRGNHLETYASVYEQTKTTMTFWLQRLASGPSPKGPGH